MSRSDGLVRTRDGDLTAVTDHDARCDGTGRIDGAGYDAAGRPRPCHGCRPHLAVPGPARRRGRR